MAFIFNLGLGDGTPADPPTPAASSANALWLPADEARWRAYLTDDEPGRSPSIAGTAPSGSPGARRQARPPTQLRELVRYRSLSTVESVFWDFVVV
jgi:hypothetical protein